jgi:trehalose/maltose transport system substrate-binding protein
MVFRVWGVSSPAHIVPARIRWIVSLTLLGCFTGCVRRSFSPAESSSITVLMWSAGGRGNIDDILIDEFSRRTGIAVHLVPASESSSQRLKQELALLQRRSAAVDVFQIDSSWVARLAPYLVDLRPYLTDRLEGELPDLLEAATFNRQIVAAPFLVGYGLLYYRTDLLQKYGFKRPPRTWSELELQSRRIQRGERRSGNKNFWGYVWQGAEYEGLTCNALEWQYSGGGGNFVTAEKAVNVSNPPAIRAFARAAGWVGTISPPGVTAYVEEDSRNVWQSGNAAFLRNWGYVYPLARQSREVGKVFSVAPLPAGEDSHSSVLGGWYLGITSATHHRADALTFISFMTSEAAQKRRAIKGGFLPTIRSIYHDPEVLRSSQIFDSVAEVVTRSIRRPTSVIGPAYSCASAVYAHGVHQIITGRMSPDAAAKVMKADLQKILDAPPQASQDCW